MPEVARWYPPPSQPEDYNLNMKFVVTHKTKPVCGLVTQLTVALLGSARFISRPGSFHTTSDYFQILHNS